jgi:hypothetical protein
VSDWLVEIVQIVTAVGILFNGTAALLGFLQSRKNAIGIEKVHLATNSMKDALVEATGKASLLEGHAAGLAEGRGEATAVKGIGGHSG